MVSVTECFKYDLPKINAYAFEGYSWEVDQNMGYTYNRFVGSLSIEECDGVKLRGFHLED